MSAYAADPLYSKSKRDRYLQLKSRLWTERSTFDAHWRELADFLIPRRVRFTTTDRNRGDKRNQNIIDSTARFSVNTLRSGLHAGLTSPARPWMKLSTPDPDLAEFGPVKEWLHVATQRMLTVFLQSNLYNTLPIVYGDMGVFATAAMSVLDDDEDLFRSYHYPIGSYAIAMDARGKANTFIREYEMTVGQVVEAFLLVNNGRDIDWARGSVKLKEQWDRGEYEAPVEVCWVVTPNRDKDRTRIESRFLPFSSCHFEVGNGEEEKILRESGFQTFPIMCPRWDVTSSEDSYGTDSPGITALGDVKQLQIMQRRKGQAIAKMIDPPLVGPPDLRQQKTSLLPGDITYLNVRDGMQGLKSIHDVNLRIDHLGVDISQVQYRIQRAFYEDLFLMLATSNYGQEGGQPITAREVEERHEEKLLALGPVLERTNDELLDPFVDRVFLMMERTGLLPPAPPELEGVKLKVEYTSIMAQAQKLVGVVGQDRFVQSVVVMAQTFPGVVHKVNVNRLVDNYGDMLGVDPRVIRSDDEADELAGAEARAIQQQAEAEQAKNMSQAVKNAATAPMEGDTALNRLTQAVAG